MKWTVQEIKKEASKYCRRGEFKKNNAAAYAAALRRNILDDVCSHMEYIRYPWTMKELKIEAKKYKTRTEFFKNNIGAYTSARNQNVLNKICSHMPKHMDIFGDKNPNVKWPLKSIKNEAKKYTSRFIFATHSSLAYQAAQQRKILDNVCSHMKYPSRSRQEGEVLTFLQSLKSDFKSENFGKYKIDCFSESLKIGIEYNGLYHHSTFGIKRGRKKISKKDTINYHLNKTKYFESKGIRLIHIWAHEWEYRRKQVKNFLRSACGLNEIKIGARKCSFKEIPWSESRDFLNYTHIQGAPHYSIFSIGCFYKNELVGVCTFGKHHRKINQIVLNRFACKSGYNIMGFLSKASKMAFEKFKTPIVSWADYSKSQAKGYLSAGWKIEELLKPDYFYFNPRKNTVHSKQSRKKSNVNTPTGMTELEHSIKDGLLRVYDCGKIRLIFNLDLSLTN